MEPDSHQADQELSRFGVNDADWRHYAVAASVTAALLCVVGLAQRLVVSLGYWPVPSDLSVTAMRANPALCLLALAVAVCWQGYRKGPSGALFIDALCLFSALVAIVTASQYLTGADLQLDNALFQHLPDPGNPHPGRMGLPTALAIALLAAGIVVLQLGPDHPLRRLSTVLASLGVVLPYASSIVQLHDMQAPSWWWQALGTSSLTTNTVVVLMGTALFALQPTRSGYRPTGPASVAGRYLRAVLPMALLLPVATAWMRWGAGRMGLYGGNSVLLWMVVVSTGLFVASVLLSRRWMARFEKALWHSQEDLEQRVRERTRELADALLRIQETEQRFRVLAEASPTIIWTSDAEGRIAYANRRLAEYTGEPVERHTGHGWIDLLHPDDREGATQAFMQARATRRPYKYQYRLRGQDGGYRWFIAQGAATYEGTHRFTGYVGTSVDIHDAKEATLALQQSQQQLSAIIEFADVAIISVDEAHRIVLFNAAAERIFGRSAAEMMGQTVDPLLPDRVRPGHDEKMRAFDASGETTRRLGGVSDLSGLRANGEEFPIEASISRFEVGGQRLLTVVLRDVSQARALERERHARAAAEEANQAKTRFLSHLSHELRTPLNAVIGFSQLLLHQRSVARDSDVERYAQHILEAGRHQLSMINDLLDLSRIDANQIQLDVRRVPVAKALRESLQLVTQQAQAAGVALDDRVLTAEGVAVQADAARLRQILTNLLTNAVKYNECGGRVTVQVQPRPGDEVAIEVHDTGLGMTEEQMSQLFTPFSRLGRENSPIEGTGIGLSLSKRLAELMDGRIEVRSQPGEGSTFTLVLPAGGNGDCRPDGTTGATAAPDHAQEPAMSTFDPARQDHDPHPHPDQHAERETKRTQAAVENVREGYGHSAKAGIISGKPDGDTQGGPGANNDNANPPDATKASTTTGQR